MSLICFSPEMVADDAVALIRSTMSRHAGVRRSAPGLAAAEAALRGLPHPAASGTPSLDATHRWVVAAAIVAAAAARHESRGCHWRSDFPEANDAWRHRVVVRLDGTGIPVADSEPALSRSA